MNGMALDIDFLRGWVGKEAVTDEVLTPALAEKFHATLGLPGTAAKLDEPAPRLIHFCLCQRVAPTAILGRDGHIALGGFLPPAPLPRRMWAAGKLSFTGEMRVGQAVRRRSRVADVTMKQGQSGSLCFVTVNHSIETDGVQRVAEEQTIVYREATTPVAAPGVAGVPAARGVAARALVVAPPLLFRYSALTFNTHRIHYDRDYARDEEGYPGLVVHGPLQATMLFHFAAERAGHAAPDHFAFRSLAPLFDHDDISLHADASNDGRMTLWSARAGGPMAMQAEARWG